MWPDMVEFHSASSEIEGERKKKEENLVKYKSADNYVRWPNYVLLYLIASLLLSVLTAYCFWYLCTASLIPLNQFPCYDAVEIVAELAHITAHLTAETNTQTKS